MAEERDLGFLYLNHPLHFRSSLKRSRSHLTCLGFLLYLTWYVLLLTQYVLFLNPSYFFSLVLGVYHQISLLAGLDDLNLMSTGFQPTIFQNNLAELTLAPELIYSNCLTCEGSDTLCRTPCNYEKRKPIC